MKTIHYIEAGHDGRILRSGTFVGRSLDDMRAMFPGNLVEVPHAVEPCADYLWDGAAAVRLPARPSIDHHFDYSRREWLADINRAWAKVRAERDARLAASDWVRLRAADLGEPVPPKWLQYRQALRDVTYQTDPLNIVWPEAPA
jgi:hypothetical protein